ncbi:hypothetical protein X564_09845 [Pseudoalteromonas agarivorans]|nr:hypothetical protein X564_09845 [Pseudoalteromonas agarivorans]
MIIFNLVSDTISRKMIKYFSHWYTFPRKGKNIAFA